MKSLGVSYDIEEGIRKMRERSIPERPAEDEDSRKGLEEGRGCASLVQGSGHMMSWTRHGKGEGNGSTEEQEGRRKDGGGGEGNNVPASHHEGRDMQGTKSEEDVELQQAVEVGEQQECTGTVVTRKKMRSSMRRRRREETSRADPSGAKRLGQ